MISFWRKICSGRRSVNSGARRIARSARCSKTRLCSEGTTRKNPAVVSTSRWLCLLSLAWGSFRSSLATQSSGRSGSSLPLALVEQLLSTTAQEDFGGRENVYEAAIEWSRNRFFHKNINNNRPATTGEDYGTTYIVCSNTPRETLVRLESSLSPASVRKLAVGAEFGACFLATAASPDVAKAVYDELSGRGLTTYVMIYPSALKLAPGLLDHSLAHTTSSYDAGAQLATMHGTKMRIDNVGGLTVELSPGLLSARDTRYEAYMSDLWEDILSTSINIWATNFWSDPAMSGGKHLNTVEGSLMRQEWTRAADLVHESSKARRRSPGSACGWDSIKMHQAGDDTIIFTGLDHLLASRKVPAESEGAEFQMACFMSLVSLLTSRAEVLRVAPYHHKTVLNAVAKAISHSATTDTSETTLTAAGLDGTGEVIQVIDSGLDQESCFFRDSDGETVELGYYFDEVAVFSSNYAITLFASGGSFPVDLDRRKIVQYISLVRSDVDGEDQPYGDYVIISGQTFPWYSAEGFATETSGGHGSHTAGTAAGSAIGSTDSCSGDDELGCLGGCLNSSYVDQLVWNGLFNVEVFCPKFDCDNVAAGFEIYETCLSDDVEETVSANGGVAPGAKLAIFDTSVDGTTVWAELAGNGLWEASNETGSVVHTNSWGGNSDCTVDATSIAYDTFMYQNPEHLLVFSAGNDGNLSDSSCSVGSPAVAKNVLTVGSSSSGQTRWTSTGEDGEPLEFLDDTMSDIDTVSYFSSQGPTEDGRIKPEIVAPGDNVLSASSAGVDGESCELELRQGTSMAAPVVAAAAAMIRQYFKDDSFYVSDLKARELCDATTTTISSTNSSTSTSFTCTTFNASAATMKAMLINSANLMGGSSEPDGSRGFGRVHLDAGLPLGGTGDTGLFVADSSDTGVSQGTEDTYTFETVDSDTGEFRATLAWIDPPATTSSSSQLMHDLDLLVTSPSGQTYTMWSSGETDTSNVIERVVVSVDDFDDEESGTWTVSVSANDIVTESQPYSLVVTGPFGNGTSVDDSSMAAASLYRSMALAKSVLWVGVGLASALLAASCM